MSSEIQLRPARPWRFLGLALGATWLCWIPAAFLPEAVGRVLHYLGGAMPLVVTLALLATRHTPDMRRAYWRRALDPTRISARWWAATLLTVPLLTGLSALLDAALGGRGAALEATNVASGPWVLLPMALFTLFFGPLPEELAWRGYALPQLQARYAALLSTLALGGAWALWHLPLFFIPGSYQAGLGVGTRAFWLFMLQLFPLSLVMTWIYNHTRRSTLTAILLHFMVNFVGELFALTPRAEWFNFVGWWALAVAIVALAGPSLGTQSAGQG